MRSADVDETDLGFVPSRDFSRDLPYFRGALKVRRDLLGREHRLRTHSRGLKPSTIRPPSPPDARPGCGLRLDHDYVVRQLRRRERSGRAVGHPCRVIRRTARLRQPGVDRCFRAATDPGCCLHPMTRARHGKSTVLPDRDPLLTIPAGEEGGAGPASPRCRQCGDSGRPAGAQVEGAPLIDVDLVRRRADPGLTGTTARSKVARSLGVVPPTPRSGPHLPPPGKARAACATPASRGPSPWPPRSLSARRLCQHRRVIVAATIRRPCDAE